MWLVSVTRSQVWKERNCVKSQVIALVVSDGGGSSTSGSSKTLVKCWPIQPFHRSRFHSGQALTRLSKEVHMLSYQQISTLSLKNGLLSGACIVADVGVKGVSDLGCPPRWKPLQKMMHRRKPDQEHGWVWLCTKVCWDQDQLMKFWWCQVCAAAPRWGVCCLMFSMVLGESWSGTGWMLLSLEG